MPTFVIFSGFDRFITDDTISCISFAPDESLIVEHGRKTGVPVDRMAAERRLVDPASFQ